MYVPEKTYPFLRMPVFLLPVVYNIGQSVFLWCFLDSREENQIVGTDHMVMVTLLCISPLYDLCILRSSYLPPAVAQQPIQV